jgi:hypothetical protein
MLVGAAGRWIVDHHVLQAEAEDAIMNGSGVREQVGSARPLCQLMDSPPLWLARSFKVTWAAA